MRRRALLRGAALATVGVAGCTDDGSGGGTPTESTPTATPGADIEVTVAPGGEFEFDPGRFTISTGDTVLWVWEDGGHNVVADATPEPSDWEGTEGGPGKTYGSGHTYRHTFDVPGEYTYVCAPHQSIGMTASFAVE